MPKVYSDGWISGVSSVCVPKYYTTNATNGLIPHQSPVYHRFPVCAVCNRFVEKFERRESFNFPVSIFMASCHGSEEQQTISKEQQISDPDCVFKLVSRPWFMADYEKLKAAQPQPKAELPKIPSLLDKPTRQIDLE